MIRIQHDYPAPAVAPHCVRHAPRSGALQQLPALAASSILTLILSANTLLAAGWRSDGSSRYPDANIPLKWSTSENVIWKTKLPDWSNASPVIDGDRIFVCAEPASLLCLSKKDGSIMWQAEHTYESFLTDEEKKQIETAQPEIASLKEKTAELNLKIRALVKEIPDEALRKEREKPLNDEMNGLNRQIKELQKNVIPATHKTTGYTAPTPASDGKNVLVVFGHGVAACHSVEGVKKWAKKVGRPTHEWGHCSSPLIAGGTAVIQMNDIVGLDVETGAEKWRVPGGHIFGSLALCKVSGADCVISSEGKLIRVSDGKLIAGDLHKLGYNTPIVVNDIACFIENNGKAFRLPSDETSKPELLWTTTPKENRYYASPLFHDGLIYAITRAAEFSVIDAADGKVIHEEKLKLQGPCYPSPVLAGANILISSDGGETIILKPGRKPVEIGRNSLEKFRTTPVIENNRMYIRTMDHLFCIGE